MQRAFEFHALSSPHHHSQPLATTLPPISTLVTSTCRFMTRSKRLRSSASNSVQKRTLVAPPWAAGMPEAKGVRQPVTKTLRQKAIAEDARQTQERLNANLAGASICVAFDDCSVTDIRTTCSLANRNKRDPHARSDGGAQCYRRGICDG